MQLSTYCTVVVGTMAAGTSTNTVRGRTVQ